MDEVRCGKNSHSGMFELKSVGSAVVAIQVQASYAAHWPLGGRERREGGFPTGDLIVSSPGRDI